MLSLPRIASRTKVAGGWKVVAFPVRIDDPWTSVFVPSGPQGCAELEDLPPVGASSEREQAERAQG